MRLVAIAHERAPAPDLPDGIIRQIRVGRRRDLSTAGLGDAVRARYTPAIAIPAEGP